MEKICPITDRVVNENVARITAIETVALIFLSYLLQSHYLLWFLLIDFILRGVVNGELSPLRILNTRLANLIGVKVKKINAGPKIFAAQVGTFLLAMGIVFSLLKFQIASNALLITLAFFSFLEGAFGFCVACKIYPLFRRVSG